MKWFLVIAALLVVVLAVLGVRQHLLYADLRSHAVQDRQTPLYGSNTFHTVTYIKARSPFTADVLQPLADFLQHTEGARLIYAGQAAFTGSSTALAPDQWDAVVLVQFTSREVRDGIAETPAYRGLMASFADTYTHGFIRPALQNLLIHQLLLLTRITDGLRGYAAEPLEPMPPEELGARGVQLLSSAARLRALTPINDQAVLVFNASRAGSPEQQAADAQYVGLMMSRMAAGNHGPMHMGRAVVIEGDASYEDVAIVYYPGPEYFASLLSSRFFQQIIGNKQLGENLSVPTVPITERLIR